MSVIARLCCSSSQQVQESDFKVTSSQAPDVDLDILDKKAVRMRLPPCTQSVALAPPIARRALVSASVQKPPSADPRLPRIQSYLASLKHIRLVIPDSATGYGHCAASVTVLERLVALSYRGCIDVFCVDHTTRRTVINLLEMNPKVKELDTITVWVTKCDGPCDLIISAAADSKIDFQKFGSKQAIQLQPTDWGGEVDNYIIKDGKELEFEALHKGILLRNVSDRKTVKAVKPSEKFSQRQKTIALEILDFKKGRVIPIYPYIFCAGWENEERYSYIDQDIVELLTGIKQTTDQIILSGRVVCERLLNAIDAQPQNQVVVVPIIGKEARKRAKYLSKLKMRHNALHLFDPDKSKSLSRFKKGIVLVPFEFLPPAIFENMMVEATFAVCEGQNTTTLLEQTGTPYLHCSRERIGFSQSGSSLAHAHYDLACSALELWEIEPKQKKQLEEFVQKALTGDEEYRQYFALRQAEFLKRPDKLLTALDLLAS